jgi:hypothetical protein
MMGTAAKRAEKTKDREKIEHLQKLYKAAMNYAEKLIEEIMNPQPDNFDMYGYDSTANLDLVGQVDEFWPLTDAGKAEVALVVLLYFHMVGCAFALPSPE